MGVSPFEAAHGLPADTAVSRMADEGDYCAPDTIDQPGVTAMQTTAKALAQILCQQQQQEAVERARMANQRGHDHTFKEGDTVSFFIPPTAKEAEELGRKVKHIAHFKGPAKVVKQLSNTTFAITYEGSTYGRCSSELRAYNSDDLPNLPRREDTPTRLQMHNFVALSDTDDVDSNDYNMYHVGEVINIADGQAHVQNYATSSRNLKTAKWQPLYQLSSGAYTTVKPRTGAKSKRVIDVVDIDDTDYIRHANLKMTTSHKVAASSRNRLARLGHKHHVLGLTFP